MHIHTCHMNTAVQLFPDVDLMDCNFPLQRSCIFGSSFLEMLSTIALSYCCYYNQILLVGGKKRKKKILYVKWLPNSFNKLLKKLVIFSEAFQKTAVSEHPFLSEDLNILGLQNKTEVK